VLEVTERRSCNVTRRFGRRHRLFPWDLITQQREGWFCDSNLDTNPITTPCCKYRVSYFRSKEQVACPKMPRSSFPVQIKLHVHYNDRSILSSQSVMTLGVWHSVDVVSLRIRTITSHPLLPMKFVSQNHYILILTLHCTSLNSQRNTDLRHYVLLALGTFKKILDWRANQSINQNLKSIKIASRQDEIGGTCNTHGTYELHAIF